MIRKSKLRGFIINEYVLSIPEVQEMVERDGVAGIGKLAGVCMSLVKYYHCIGMMDNVAEIARRIKMRRSALERWIRTCGVFIITEDDSLFYFRYLHNLLTHMGDVSKAELDYVRMHGNKLEAMVCQELEDAKTNELSNVYDHESCNKVATKLEQSCKKDELKKSQVSDKKGVTQSPYNNNDTDSYSYSNITNIMSNTYYNTTSSSELPLADADDESSFNFFEKKILESVRWRKATSDALCVNLTDDGAARCFARWMYNYCVSHGKLSKGSEWILKYASNLLAQGMRTRKCYDVEYARYVKEHEAVAVVSQSGAGVCNKRHSSGSFERIINGVRYGLGGQPLPNDAPHQTDPETRWSYIMNCWVNVAQWDRDREMAFYREMKDGRREKRDDGHEDMKAVGQIITDEILPGLIARRLKMGDADCQEDR